MLPFRWATAVVNSALHRRKKPRCTESTRSRRRLSVSMALRRRHPFDRRHSRSKGIVALGSGSSPKTRLRLRVDGGFVKPGAFGARFVSGVLRAELPAGPGDFL